MDFSRLQRTELVGLAGSLLLLVSLFVPWYSIDESTLDQRAQQVRQGADPWICGAGDLSCTAWETFPINRILFLLAVLAPLILIYLVLTDEKGEYPTGEFTMTVGFAVIVLVSFNGLISKPGTGIAEVGVSLSWGYFLALLAGLLMAVAGALRSLESGGGAQRKPPATF